MSIWYCNRANVDHLAYKGQPALLEHRCPIVLNVKSVSTQRHLVNALSHVKRHSELLAARRYFAFDDELI